MGKIGGILMSEEAEDDIFRNGAYAIGICATNAKEQFGQYVNDSLGLMLRLLDQCEDLEAKDNVIACIHRIICHHVD